MIAVFHGRYVPELDRIVLKESASARPFASTATCRKAVITTRILQLVHELCVKRIHVTKRDLFYTDVKLFEVQTEPSDMPSTPQALHEAFAVSKLLYEGQDMDLTQPVSRAPAKGSKVRQALTAENHATGRFCCILRRTKATRTASSTTSPACWAAPGQASMVLLLRSENIEISICVPCNHIYRQQRMQRPSP